MLNNGFIPKTNKYTNIGMIFIQTDGVKTTVSSTS